MFITLIGENIDYVNQVRTDVTGNSISPRIHHCVVLFPICDGNVFIVTERGILVEPGKHGHHSHDEHETNEDKQPNLK